MSTSTDAILFYGYHLQDFYFEDDDTYEQLQMLYKAPVQIEEHCAPECEMYYIYYADSRTVARRGYPKQIERLPNMDDADYEIIEFARQYNLPLPGTENTSEIGWWLASWWG
jgi:hypothetical protein